MKRIVLVIGLLCACTKTTPQTGSQTHFLAQCEDSCPAPYDCVCGVCTRSCSESGSDRCASEHPEASCVKGAGIAPACESGALVCDLQCDAAADCDALGAGYRCEHGRCRGADMSAAAGSGASGSSGTAGAGHGAGSGGMSAAGVGGTDQIINAGSSSAGTGGDTAMDAGSTTGNECGEAADCVLVTKGCCGACEPSKDAYVATLKGREQAAMTEQCPAGPVSCNPCSPIAYDPKRAAVRAACIDGACTVVDLREEPESACTNNDDCNLVSLGCCGSCGPDPRGWIALSSETGDPYAEVCDPIPPCEPCGEILLPEAVCADDGHCAVREVARLDGEPSDSCFSPEQNVAAAPEVTSRGCDCAEGGLTVCATDLDGGVKHALTCIDQHWIVNDGPPCN